MEAARLRSRNIRPREIFTREKQGHAGNRRDCVRHRVPEIQARGMTSPSEPEKCGRGGIQMFLVERHHFGIQAAQESEEQRTGILAQPRGQNHRGFEQSRDSDHHDFGLVDGFDEALVAGFLEVNGNDGGAIQNHDSVAFRPVAQHLVFLFAAENPSKFAGRN